jgi:hypothetical protein
MAVVFATTALLWIFRQPVAGFGWAPWLGVSDYVTDATVAMTMAVVCFIVPAGRLRGPALLNWECTRRVPWGILLLFGGGLALAEGMKASGLDVYLGERLGSRIAEMSPSIAATLTALAMTFLSELTSNVACVNMSMPVLATTAQTAGCDPRLLMISATLAASCAFMLPVATPPNAIIYGSGQVRVTDMIRTGLVLNLLGPPLIVTCVILLGGPILGITLDGLPDWAAPDNATSRAVDETGGLALPISSVDLAARIRHNALSANVVEDTRAYEGICCRNGTTPAVEGRTASLSIDVTLFRVRDDETNCVTTDLIPQSLREKYRFQEWRHACAVLKEDFRHEWQDILDGLERFVLRRTDIVRPGGRKSHISESLDAFWQGERGWVEKSFDVKIVVDGDEIPTPTHKIDNYKNRVGVEVEWNNKTEFYDRDLNNFRLLHELGVLSVGVIVTRQSELQQLFNDLGKGSSYGASTTHWDKLIPKIEGGGAGGCPLLVVGLGLECYDDHS